MDIAIAHDWLLNRRGAEKVLKEFCLCFEDLSIFTLFFNPDVVDPVIKQHSIYVSKLDRLPGIKHYYRYLLPWFQLGIETHSVRDKDVLLSISHAVAKGIPHQAGIPHVCYCHTPMRYLWEPGLYQSFLVGSWRGRVLDLFARRLQKWDLKSNQRVDYFVTISRTVQKRIERAYGRESQVIYPCIDLEFFQPYDVPREDFYLVVSALVPHKRLELAVQALNQNGKALLVVGTGPLRRRLARKAGSNIQFLGWVSDEDVRMLYCRARALVLPGPEELGLVPIEAQACGCPVIAYGEDGATETVIEGKTGLFFRQPTAESLLEAVRLFEGTNFDVREIVTNAQRFSRQRFRAEWQQFFKNLGLNVQMC
ncbi:glycosyltransferase [Acidobacteria bacterium AH-259-G07]|nr:glycosyltransferase [Acidobacteria bacterium AH-259-G07]